MADFYLRRVGNGFVPNSEEDSETIKAWPLGDVIKVRATKPRNVKFHRKYFALLDLLWNHGGDEKFDNREAMRAWVICKAGHYDVMSTTVVEMPEDDWARDIRARISAVLWRKLTKYCAKKTVVVRPKSISFAQMDEAEFGVLYARTIQIALSGVLQGGWTEADVEAYMAQAEAFV